MSSSKNSDVEIMKGERHQNLGMLLCEYNTVMLTEVSNLGAKNGEGIWGECVRKKTWFVNAYRPPWCGRQHH